MPMKENGNSSGKGEKTSSQSESSDELLKNSPSSSRRKSSVLIAQFPSKHLDTLLNEEALRGTEQENVISLLRKKDSDLRSQQLKYATLNARANVGAETIYEVLTSIPNAKEENHLKALKEMQQTLGVKRRVRQMLAAVRRERIATQSLSLWKQFKLQFLLRRKKLKHKIKYISHYFELWESSIKSIQGKYGSGVATYFICLRWILYLNIWNFFITFCFVVIPQLVYEASIPDSTSDSLQTFKAHDLLTGSGSFNNSAFYFGHYTDRTFQAIPHVSYDMPLAYLSTIGVNFLVNLIRISSSITATYQKNYVDIAGEIKHVFCNKLFSAWAFTIQTNNAACLQKEAFCNNIEEILLIKREGQKILTPRQKVIQRTSIFLHSLFCYLAICGIGYLVYYLLLKKSLQVHIKILAEMTLPFAVTFITCVAYVLLKYSSRVQIYLSSKMKLYLIMTKVVSLRIVILGIVVYFWMVIYKPPRDQNICFENELGEEIYRLIVTNFLVDVLFFTLILEFPLIFLRKYFQSIKKPEFDLAFNILELIYYQTLAWIAIAMVPLGSLLIIITLILLFYLKRLSLSFNCQPPQKFWSLNEAQMFYLMLTFVMFFFAALSVAYSLFGTETSECGPFRGYDTVSNVFLEAFQGEGFFSLLMQNLISPQIVFGFFLVINIIVYYMSAQANAQVNVIKQIREQLLLRGKDQKYLLNLYDEAFAAEQNRKTLMPHKNVTRTVINDVK